VNPAAGDRIVIHGWIYDLPWNIANVMAPRRWDVVVFKYPPDPSNNFIKRLIGLPGETVEIVDGDIFINGRIARKPEYAQRALWMPVYHHDYLPARQAAAEYQPRWVPQNSGAWAKVDTRIPVFDGKEQPRHELLFVTDPRSGSDPGWIVDKNGYNGPLIHIPGIHIAPYHVQSDVRLSAVAEIEDGTGFVELEVTKYDMTFRLRLAADGAWSVESRRNGGDAGAAAEFSGMARGTIAAVRARAVPISLGVADYQVTAELDGHRVFASTDEQYSVTLDVARERSVHPRVPRIVIAAEKIVAKISRIVIDRDVFYTNDVVPPGRELHAGLGNPFALDEDDYFVLGDNSRASSDARVWDEVGPHLRDDFAAGKHRPGTIPRDQLLGRAFFVYWPGVRSLVGRFPILPDVGNIRWIR
jgi:signal peptidase I